MSRLSVRAKFQQLLAPTKTAAGTRLLALDGLRGTAALMVVASHVYTTTHGEAGELAWALADRAGLGGVVLFFALSGFLLALPWARAEVERRPAPTLRDYALRRVLRIFPSYYVSVLVLAVFRIIVLHKEPISPKDMVLHFVFLPTFGASLLTVYWTLQVEEFFYWALPALHGAAARWGTHFLLVASAAIAAGWAVASRRLVDATGIPLNIWWLQTPFLLPAFALGIAAARAYARHATVPHARMLAIIGWGGYLTWTPLAFWARLRFGDIATGPAALALAPFATMIVLSTASGAQEFFRNGVVRFFGLISFSLYLWHLVIIRIMPLPSVLGASFWTRLPVTIAVAAPVSFMLYVAIERPFMRLRPRG